MEYADNSNHTSCVKCKDFTTLINLDNGRSFCFPDFSRNCKVAVGSSIHNRVYECSECNDNFYLTTVNVETPNFCVKIQDIQNCLKYDINYSDVSDSSFKCLECEKGFFIDKFGFFCQKRLNIVENCLTYDLTADKCSDCGDLHYINSLGTQCILNPFGI